MARQMLQEPGTKSPDDDWKKLDSPSTSWMAACSDFMMLKDVYVVCLDYT